MPPFFLLYPSAIADLDDIYDYICDDSQKRAESFMRSLRSKFQLLAENPKIGRSRTEIKAHVRSLPYGNYIIFYTITHYDVDIVRVLHSSRDIDSIMSDY